MYEVFDSFCGQKAMGRGTKEECLAFIEAMVKTWHARREDFEIKEVTA